MNSSFGIFVYFSTSFHLLEMISIAKSTGMLGNNDTTSNETKTSSAFMVVLLTRCLNSTAFFVLYLEFTVRFFNMLVMYLHNLYAGAFTDEQIGLSGSRRWKEVEKYTNIPKELFMRILTFTTKENRFFKYKEKIYTQLKGMPMGSPLSPILADIVMEELLNKCMDSLEHKPKLLTKYVDDLFGIIKKDEVQNTLEALNKFHRNIKFTVEIEKNGQLPYLDSIAIRKENKVKINWYQKPTASGRIINYKSKHPRNIIINTANNFIRRVLTTSDPMFHAENKDKIMEILKKNNFPEATSRGLIHKFYSTQNRRGRNDDNSNPPRKYKSVAYIPELTDTFRKSKLYNKEEYRIAPNIKNTTQQFFSKTKSKLEDGEKSNIVYEIKCLGNGDRNCDMIYIGTTKNKLKTRVAQHKSDQRLRRNTLMEQKTALAAHCAAHNHIADFDNARVVCEERHYTKRLTLEMLHITKVQTEQRINARADIDNVAQVYRELITNQ